MSRGGVDRLRTTGQNPAISVVKDYDAVMTPSESQVTGCVYINPRGRDVDWETWNAIPEDKR